MRSRKILNIVVVLLTVFFIVSFILSQVIVDDIFKNLFSCLKMDSIYLFDNLKYFL